MNDILSVQLSVADRICFPFSTVTLPPEVHSVEKQQILHLADHHKVLL